MVKFNKITRFIITNVHKLNQELVLTATGTVMRNEAVTEVRFDKNNYPGRLGMTTKQDRNKPIGKNEYNGLKLKLNVRFCFSSFHKQNRLLVTVLKLVWIWFRTSKFLRSCCVGHHWYSNATDVTTVPRRVSNEMSSASRPGGRQSRASERTLVTFWS